MSHYRFVWCLPKCHFLLPWVSLVQHGKQGWYVDHRVCDVDVLIKPLYHSFSLFRCQNLLFVLIVESSGAQEKELRLGTT